MEARHRLGELEPVCILPHLLYDWEGSKILVGQLLRGAVSLNVAGIQENLISRLELQCWSLVVVVVPGHVILGLLNGGAGFLCGGLHALHELIHHLHS